MGKRLTQQERDRRELKKATTSARKLLKQIDGYAEASRWRWKKVALAGLGGFIRKLVQRAEKEMAS